MVSRLVDILKRHWVVITVIAIIILACAIRITLLVGFERIDSLDYSQEAYNLSHGVFFTGKLEFGITRLTYLAPIAFSYLLFGVTEFSSILPILIINVSGIIVLYLIGVRINKATGLIAAFIAAFYPLEAVSATRMLPDGMGLLFTALPVYLFITGAETQKKRWLYFLSAGLVWGLSYYIKINYILLLPIFVATYSIFKRKFAWDYTYTLLGFALVWLVYGLIFYFNTGIFLLHEYHHLFIKKYGISAFNELQGRIFSLSPQNLTVATKIHRPSGGVLQSISDFVAMIIHNKHLMYFVLASIIASIYLLVTGRRKYSLFYIIIIAYIIYELVAQVFGWDYLERYLTMLTPLIILPIAATLYELLKHRVVFKSLAILVLAVGMVYSIYNIKDQRFHHHQQSGRIAGFFIENKMFVQKTHLTNKDTVLLPNNTWARSLNMYLGFGTGYNSMLNDVCDNTSSVITLYKCSNILKQNRGYFIFDNDADLKSYKYIIADDSLVIEQKEALIKIFENTTPNNRYTIYQNRTFTN